MEQGQIRDKSNLCWYIDWYLM